MIPVYCSDKYHRRAAAMLPCPRSGMVNINAMAFKMYFFAPTHIMYFLAQKVPKTRGVPIPPAPPQTARDFRPWTPISGSHAFLFWRCFSFSYFRSIISISAMRGGSHKRRGSELPIMQSSSPLGHARASLLTYVKRKTTAGNISCGCLFFYVLT